MMLDPKKPRKPGERNAAPPSGFDSTLPRAPAKKWAVIKPSKAASAEPGEDTQPYRAVLSCRTKRGSD